MAESTPTTLDATRFQLAEQLVGAYGYNNAMSALAKMSGYVDSPPDIHTFINDSDFLGNVLGTRLYPAWRLLLEDIFPNPFYSPYLEVILSGAIGTGKTTVAIAGSLYDLCKLTYLDHPQRKYKLIDSTVIAYAIINATMSLAKDVLFDQLIEWIEASPYFRTLGNKSSGRTKFPKGIDIITGSRFDQVMGRAIVGAILDELNFQNRVSNQAYDNYNSVRARIESRFLGRGGSWPAHLFLVSSKSDDTGWLQTHINAMREVPTTKIVEYPIWHVLECKGIYSGEKFKVFIGDKARDPFLIDRPEQIIGMPDELIIDVPMEYYQNFKGDIFRSLQDLAGSGTWSFRNFISSVELIEECQIRENPVTKDIITLDFFDQSQRLIDFLLYERLAIDSRPRFIHIDIGLRKDKTGIACTRFDGFVNLKRFDPRTGLTMSTREPIYYTDFVMAIEPRPGHEVPLYKIKALITDLRKREFPIAKVTVDGYQSANLRQDLELIGFEVDEVSVDKKKDPYLHFKNSILESRLNCVRHPILDNELRNLIDTDKKIDHKKDMSKDVSDALCGSIWTAYQNMESWATVMSSSEYSSAFEKYISEENTYYDVLFGAAESFHPTYQGGRSG